MTNCKGSTGESTQPLGAVFDRMVARRSLDHARAQAEVDLEAVKGKSWVVECLRLFGVPVDLSAATVKVCGHKMGVPECLGALSGFRLWVMEPEAKVVGLMVTGARRRFTRRLEDREYSAVAVFKMYWPALTAARTCAQSILARRES